MSRVNLPLRPQGHRFNDVSNKDLQQKLTYQQLINLNHDLSKQNIQLKNIGHRLGTELKSLHTQFDIHSNEDNVQIYNAIGTHPTLHQFENTLMPLLEAYQNKIQQFQGGFENLNEQFIALEKRFEQVMLQNDRLKSRLTERNKQLLQVYRAGASQQIQSDFSQMILAQINEKQKSLVGENQMLERQYQKYKSESNRQKNELDQLKKKHQETKNRLRDFQIKNEQNNSEIKTLKSNIFELELKNNELENEKKKIEQAHQRAQSQINRINKEKDMFKDKLQQLRNRIQKDTSVSLDSGKEKEIEALRTKIAFMEAEQGPSDIHKKFDKLQKELDHAIKEKNRVRETLESGKVKQEELNQLSNELRQKISNLQTQKTTLAISQSKLKKQVEYLKNSKKQQITKMRRDYDKELQQTQDTLNARIQLIDKKLSQTQQQLETVKLERDKLEKQNSINNKQNNKQTRNKDSERVIEKLKDKIRINQEIFQDQIKTMENQKYNLKHELDSLRIQVKQLTQENRRLKQDLQKTRKDYEDTNQQKTMLVEQIRRVRNEYETTLREKEKLFEGKIKQIKVVVQESDKKRRQEKEKVQQATRQYKRVLQEIKATYEHRIRELESQLSQGGNVEITKKTEYMMRQ